MYNPDPDNSVLQAFMESLLPWQHVPPEAAGNADGAGPEDDAAIDALFE